MWKVKVTGPDSEIQWNEALVKPVVTLEGEYGGRVQIVTDDHCYVVLLQQSDGKYKTTAWIFKEVHEVLKNLPALE